MAIGANSYGSVAGVAALTPRFSGTDFAATTRPTLAQVESWINQVSGMLNSVLSEAGFDIPVSQADAKLMLDAFTNEEVAAMVEGVNGAGRFGPAAAGKSSRRKGHFAMILEDARAFIEVHALGIERLGATRTYSQTAGLGFRDTDASGDETHPLFQREDFGEIYGSDDA